MIVREALKTDVKEIGLLYGEMVDEVYSKKVCVEKWVEETKKLIFKDSNIRIIIVLKDFKIIGFLQVTLTNDFISGEKMAFGQNLFVSKNFRNSNTIFYLWRQSMKIGKNMGIEVIQILTPLKGDSEKFWIKMGFKPIQTIMERKI